MTSLKMWIPKLIFYLLCLLFFCLPLKTAMINVSGGLTLGLWFLSGQFLKLKDKAFFKKQIEVWPVILLFLLPWLGMLYSPDPSLGLRIAEKSYYWLFFFVMACLSSYGLPAKYLVRSFMAGLTLYLLYFTIFAHYIIISPAHITASLFFVLGMLMLSFYFKKAISIKARLIILTLFLGYFTALIFCQGRIGYLAFVLLIPIMLFNFFKIKYIIRASFFYLIIMAIFFISPPVKQRLNLAIKDIKLTQTGNYNTSIGKRIFMWKGALRVFLDHPILGAGTGGYRLAMKQDEHSSFNNKHFSHPHNSFLHMAANFGIVGLMALLCLFYILLKKSWRYKDTEIGFFILSTTLIILIGSLTDTQILSCATGIMFALITGLQSFLVASR
jgi:O-antigen ligase